jgi:hypothetical protein
MIAEAERALAGFTNVEVVQNNGVDLSTLESESLDFAFSGLVFQHSPTKAIVRNYIREVARVLRRLDLSGSTAGPEDL